MKDLTAGFSVGDDVEVVSDRKFTGWLGKVVSLEGAMIVSVGVLLDRPPSWMPQHLRDADKFGPGQLKNLTKTGDLQSAL